jgi:hypothetical protein
MILDVIRLSLARKFLQATKLAILPKMRLGPTRGVSVINASTGYELHLTGSVDYCVIVYDDIGSEFILSTSLLVTDLFDDQPSSSSSENIFDDLPALSAPPESDLCDELDRYLSTDPEHVTNALAWWHEKRFVYPHLHCMALDYLTIPGEFYLLFDSLIFILTSDFFTSNIRGC